jgi:hypothetical protein
MMMYCWTIGQDVVPAPVDHQAHRELDRVKVKISGKNWKIWLLDRIGAGGFMAWSATW